jgi:hypothetical protein
VADSNTGTALAKKDLGPDLDAYRAAAEELVARCAGALTVGDLSDFGWFDLYADEPDIALASLFEALGAAATGVGAVDAVLGALAGAHGINCDAWLHPLPGAASPAGPPPGIGKIEVTGLMWAAPTDATLGHLVVAPGEAPRLVIIKPDADGVAFQPLGGIAPNLGMRRCRVIGTVVDSAPAEFAAAAWTDLQRALCHLVIGLSTSAISITSAHVSTREQFGNPIGSFQAIRHLIVDAYVAVEAVRRAVACSWVPGEDVATTLAVARILAARSAELTLHNSLQACGGMGFTSEFPLEIRLRLGLLLAHWYAGPPATTAALGEALLRSTQLPRLSRFGPFAGGV